MKNKVLATLLAVCLFAGLAVPAFAAYSSQSANDSDITKLEFVKTSYEVKNGKTPGFYGEIRAYAGNKQLVQEPAITWSVENDDKFAFGVNDDGTVTCGEDSGTATLIATANDGKVTAKTKLVAVKNATVYATGFRFEAASKTLYYGPELVALGTKDAPSTDFKDQVIKITPYPKDSVFTEAQKTDIKGALTTAVNAGKFSIADKAGTPNVVQPSIGEADGNVTLTYATGDNTVRRAGFVLTVATDNTTTGGTLKIDGVEIAVGASDAVADQSDAIVTAFADNSKWVVTLDGVNTAGKVRFVPKKGNTATLKADSIDKGTIATTTYTFAAKDAGIVDASTMSALVGDKIDSKRCELKVPFSSANDKITTKATLTQTISISGAPANASKTINAAGSITIEVGEKASTAKLFKQSPSAANIKYDVTYNNTLVDDNAEFHDFAVLTDNADDRSEIYGIKVGTNRINATITNIDGDTSEASIVVKVVEKGTKPAAGGNTTVLSLWSVGLGVGETSQIVAKADGKVTYKSLLPEIATVDEAGKITALKEGTVKIAVTEEGKDTVYVTVKVGATTTKPSDKPTDVPQTAVVALAPLF